MFAKIKNGQIDGGVFARRQKINNPNYDQKNEKQPEFIEDESMVEISEDDPLFVALIEAKKQRIG